jgi:uncharacterized protein (DUF1015 family)
MSRLFPFRALRPAPEAAARVASVPYDVVNAEEARALARRDPLSFLHVTRAEIDLPPDVPPYDDRVYEQAVRNFEELKRAAPMLQEEDPSLYVYQLRMGSHVQTGVAGTFSVDEYEQDLIKKHEKTRRDKEDDRTRHMVDLRAQTGVVFLTYKSLAAIDDAAAVVTKGAPLYDVTAPDGVRHRLWKAEPDAAAALVRGFEQLPALYIADGHHRAASAARARAELRAAGGRTADADRFIAVAFPDSAMQILPYHRTVKDLAGHTAESLIGAIRASEITVTHGKAVPGRAGLVSMFLDGRWHSIELPPPPADAPRAEQLDVDVLQRRILEPFLRVGDPRTDKRIDFVGGIRGTDELERLVASNRAAVAFSLHPVSIVDLMAISDAGGIMPPKSTWFEPKLRDGFLVHLI